MKSRQTTFFSTLALATLFTFFLNFTGCSSTANIKTGIQTKDPFQVQAMSTATMPPPATTTASSVRHPAATKAATNNAAISNTPSGSGKTAAGTLIINSPTIEVKGGPAPKIPRRGMSKAEVEKEFGAPNRKTKPIGKPPISRWFYDEFKVFFEHSHVIQAVTMQ